MLAEGNVSDRGYWLTVETGVVGLNESLGDLAILNKEHVALAAVVTEDGAAVEAQVEGLGELARGVTQEANLTTQIRQSMSMSIYRREYIHRSCPGGPGSRPKPWSCIIMSIHTQSGLWGPSISQL